MKDFWGMLQNSMKDEVSQFWQNSYAEELFQNA